MPPFLVAYLASALIFFPLDFVWLSTMNTRFYRPQIGALLRDDPNLAVAGLFYLAYLVGLVVLVVLPASSVLNAALLGALFGAIAYGTYDLTNLSTMRGFTVTVAVVDMAWGALLSGVTAAGAYWVAARFAA